MNESKVKFGVLVLVMVILIWCIPVAGAENTTGEGNLTNQTLIATASSETPFITIDPIGNHAIGDVFFINGTTNLPAGEDLSMSIMELYANNHTEPQFAPEYPNGDEFFDLINNISITSTASAPFGINTWSENVKDIFKGINSDNYSIGVYPSNVTLLKEFRDPNNPSTNNEPELPFAFFYLLPAAKATPIMVSQTTIPSSSPIQPIAYLTAVPQTTQSSPFSAMSPLVGIVAIILVRSIRGRKRD
ncbi:MAG: hypothetical protein ABSE74_02060 [Methanoregula sp.]|jgi:hypothetical protein